MNNELLESITADFSAEYLAGEYYIGPSICEMPILQKIEAGDWVLRQEPFLYGFLLGFVGELEQYEARGYCCFASKEEITGGEILSKYMTNASELWLAKNENGDIVAFALK